jgi:signal transduction histidine kinase/ActR/RegA family two-component response regulator
MQYMQIDKLSMRDSADKWNIKINTLSLERLTASSLHLLDSIAQRLQYLIGRSAMQRLTFSTLLAVTSLVLCCIALFTLQHLVRIDTRPSQARLVAMQLAAEARDAIERMDNDSLVDIAQSGLKFPYVRQVQILKKDDILARVSVDGAANSPSVRASTSILGADVSDFQVIVETNLDAEAQLLRKHWLSDVLVLAVCLFGTGLAGRWSFCSFRLLSYSAGNGITLSGRHKRAGGSKNKGLWRSQSQNQTAVEIADSHESMQIRISEAIAELASKNQQLERASQAKSQLLAAASHDLRQPLYALTLFADGLAEGETNPQRLERIDYVRKCVGSLDRLFSELLNLSQLDAGALQPQWSDFPLDQIFEELNRNFRPIAEERELRLVIRKTDVWVRSDYVMLTRILSNLISNSLRHTHQGGLLVGARRRGQTIRIDVVDTGVGIEPEYQRRVFEEFFQINPQSKSGAMRGMGLGLTIVQRLAGLLSSEIILTSAPNKGTFVRVMARAAAAKTQTQFVRTPVAETEQCLAGLRVLVIDDEDTILEGLQLVLGSWGMHVLAAHSNSEVQTLADAWENPPDIVLADLLLQNGDSGLSVLANLLIHPNGINEYTVCLLITGETQPDRLREATSTGVTILYKPVAPAALRQAIVTKLALAKQQDTVL